MKKLIKKDNKNREHLLQDQLKRFVFGHITKNDNFSVTARWKALVELSRIIKNSSPTAFVNRCILTGRRKRINKRYSFSRIMFLNLARLGLINGIKKSSW